MIVVNNMLHRYDADPVLRDVNIVIKDNSLVGLVGINGAGKSTFLRIISGIFKPTEGTVCIDGKNVIDKNARQGLFLLPDEPYYTPTSTINSLIKLYKTFYPGFDYEICQRVVEIYGLNPKGKIKNFSKGMRRQAFIALAFGISPKYLFLDEAFDGLDPLARKHFKDLLEELRKKHEMTVIVSSHSMLELDDFCTEFLMIDGNKISYLDENSRSQQSISKYQLVFDVVPNKEAFAGAGLEILNYKAVGHVVTITVNGNGSGVSDRIDTLGPIYKDAINVNFEDRFISEVNNKEVYL